MENHDNKAIKNENEVEEENEAAFCDEYWPDLNIGIWTHHAHLKWKLFPEKVRGIEISAYSHGYDVSSDTAHHHAHAEEEHERLHESRVVQFGYDEESEDDDQYDVPLQPVDCNSKAKKFCKTCFLFKKPESIWRSHHTGQMLACPTIPIDVKRKLVEEYKRGES